MRMASTGEATTAMQVRACRFGAKCIPCIPLAGLLHDTQIGRVSLQGQIRRRGWLAMHGSCMVVYSQRGTLVAVTELYLAMGLNAAGRIEVLLSVTHLPGCGLGIAWSSIGLSRTVPRLIIPHGPIIQQLGAVPGPTASNCLAVPVMAQALQHA